MHVTSYPIRSFFFSGKGDDGDDNNDKSGGGKKGDDKGDDKSKKTDSDDDSTDSGDTKPKSKRFWVAHPVHRRLRHLIQMIRPILAAAVVVTAHELA